MITITVYGMPGPQGSKRFVGRAKSGRGILVESSEKVKPWREAVKFAAREAMQAAKLSAPLDGPLVVGMWFTLPKPASAPKRETFPDRKPDLSKLARSTEDALSDAGLWADDARVVGYDGLWKLYPLEGVHALASPGCVIQVRELWEWQSCKWGGA